MTREWEQVNPVTRFNGIRLAEKECFHLNLVVTMTPVLIAELLRGNRNKTAAVAEFSVNSFVVKQMNVRSVYYGDNKSGSCWCMQL
jgi:hypothetical protein